MNQTRREFFGANAAAASGLSALGWQSMMRGQSPNGLLRVGVIGTGVRGKYLIGNLPESARVTAICDCAATRMADTLAPKKAFIEVLANFRDNDASRCTTYQNYQRMLDLESLDAVIIATPDHHHVRAAMLALQSGLDVYLEKPLSLTIREGRVLADTVKTTGRVLQVGSQQRTMEMNRFACEFIRDGGLGKISRIDCPNYPGPIADMRFQSEPIPDGLDWDQFLGPRPMRSHNRKLWVKEEFHVGDLLWRGWDLFRDYSGHLMTNWGAHHVDMIQYALGVDNSGPVKIAPLRSDSVENQHRDIGEAALEQDWKVKWQKKTPRPNGRFTDDRRFRPVTLQYASGAVLNLVPGVPRATFYGERGTMAISRNQFAADPVDLVADAPDPEVAEKWQGAGHVARPHLENWIDCVRTRKAPNAPVEVGHRSVTVCHLVNIVRELNRPLEWNPRDERFIGDDEANGLLDRPRRKGFELPS